MVDLLVISPGDTLIVRVPIRTSRDAVARMESFAKEHLPGIKVVVISAEQILAYRPDYGKSLGEILCDGGSIINTAQLSSQLEHVQYRAEESDLRMPDLRTPERWLETDFKGYKIMDPDGWRGLHKLSWDQPITRADFWDRMMQSTIQVPRDEEEEKEN